ncbi:MAG: hypothetical protein ABIF10_04380, partial [Candidatus Woesearchaeota archaeon]
MQKEHFDSIMRRLISRGAEGKKELYEPDAKTFEVSSKNFHKIDHSQETETAYIDASNAEIICSNDFSLHFIRVAAVSYKGKHRQWSETQEFYTLSQAITKDNRLHYEISSFPEMPKILLDPHDRTLRTGSERMTLSKTGDY